MQLLYAARACRCYASCLPEVPVRTRQHHAPFCCCFLRAPCWKNALVGWAARRSFGLKDDRGDASFRGPGINFSVGEAAAVLSSGASLCWRGRVISDDDDDDAPL